MIGDSRICFVKLIVDDLGRRSGGRNCRSYKKSIESNHADEQLRAPLLFNTVGTIKWEWEAKSIHEDSAF